MQNFYKMSNNTKNSSQDPSHSPFQTDLSVKPIVLEEKPKIKISASENVIKKTKGSPIPHPSKPWNLDKKSKNRQDIATTSSIDANLASEFTKLSTTAELEDFEYNSNLVRAKDSLENLINVERTLLNVVNSNNNSPRAASSVQNPNQDTFCPKSAPAINEAAKTPGPSSKSLTWDFEKTSKRGKHRDNKRKKVGIKQTELPTAKADSENRDSTSKPFDYKAGDEKHRIVPDSDMRGTDYSCRYRAKSTRSVVFTNEVVVVYYNGENVVYEAKEPLKKELDQQIRNKEMRKAHLILN